MAEKNTVCAECGGKYHYCASCDYDSAMSYGFCSVYCRCDWLQRRVDVYEGIHELQQARKWLEATANCPKRDG